MVPVFSLLLVNFFVCMALSVRGCAGAMTAAGLSAPAFHPSLGAWAMRTPAPQEQSSASQRNMGLGSIRSQPLVFREERKKPHTRKMDIAFYSKL